MGILDALFGRSHDRKTVATDRCMDCGTTGGSHADWCTSEAATAPGGATPGGATPGGATPGTPSPAEDPHEPGEDAPAR